MPAMHRVDGMNVVKDIEAHGSRAGTTDAEVKIVASGQLSQRT